MHDRSNDRVARRSPVLTLTTTTSMRTSRERMQARSTQAFFARCVMAASNTWTCDGTQPATCASAQRHVEGGRARCAGTKCGEREGRQSLMPSVHDLGHAFSPYASTCEIVCCARGMAVRSTVAGVRSAALRSTCRDRAAIRGLPPSFVIVRIFITSLSSPRANAWIRSVWTLKARDDPQSCCL